MVYLARYTFHVLTIPLIYSTIAVAVSPQSVGNYWFLIVGGWVVLGVSYSVTTLLSFCITIHNPHDFVALRVASAFPNIVALPILIFPSLCEFPVVYEGYAPDYNGLDELSSVTNSTTEESVINDTDLQRECVAQSTTMIFCYFFSWSMAFWSFGYPQLMNAAKEKNNVRNNCNNNNNNNNHDDSQQIHDRNDKEKASTARTPNNSHHTLGSLEEDLSSDDPCSRDDLVDEGERNQGEKSEYNELERSGGAETQKDRANKSPSTSKPTIHDRIMGTAKQMWIAFKQTTTSPGFIAMALAFVTACIPPLQKALFEPGGALRFLGSALESLGTASSPISTLVVASSLVPPSPLQSSNNGQTDTSSAEEDDQDDHSSPIFDEHPGMTDPNFGPYRRPARRRPQRERQSARILESWRISVRSASIRILQAVPRSTPDMRRLHLWFCLSRLVVAPAIVVGIILALDCSGSGVLASVPNLAKLV